MRKKEEDNLELKEDKSSLHLNASPNIFLKAKALRKNMTEAEKLLWSVLRKKQLEGLRFRRQHPILTFILDFYCHRIKLGIELDGLGHENEEQRNYDEARTCQLNEHGVTIVRYKNEEVIKDMENVKLKIMEEVAKLAKLAPRSLPAPRLRQAGPKGEEQRADFC